MLFTSHGLERRARREPLPEDLLDRDFTADPDWANAYAEQLDRALDAWRSPGVWEGDIDLGGGASASASDVAALVTKEMVVHGWDVAVATGQDLDVSEATGAFVLDVVERHGALYREYKGFAEPVSAPPGASAFTRALAHSGRAPDWTP